MLRGRVVTRLLRHVNWKRSGWVITVSSRHGGEKLVLWYGEDERLNVTGRKSDGWAEGVREGSSTDTSDGAMDLYLLV